MNYLYVPNGDEKITNALLEMILIEIGKKYGTNSKEGDRKKGIKYIVSKVPNGKVCQVKKMLKSFYNFYNILEENSNKYYYKMHKNNYGIYAKEIIKCINNDSVLKNIVASDASNYANSCSTILFKNELKALNIYINKSNIDTDKNAIVAKNIKYMIQENDFIF